MSDFKGDGFDLTVRRWFTCPFCRRRCSIATAQGGELHGQFVVSHDEPTCHGFDVADGVAFVKAWQMAKLERCNGEGGEA